MRLPGQPACGRRIAAARALSCGAVSAPTPPPAQDFASLLGLHDYEAEDGVMRARLPVRPELLQPFGLVHGGVFAAIAETLASIGTFAAVHADGMHAMGLSNNTSFLRPITAGTIHAVARARHRGRTTWLWDVEISDDEDRLCALTRVTIAVRPPRAG
jgi:1,4-dihydroxy-2-naphthoyl-CoA hydrolase